MPQLSPITKTLERIEAFARKRKEARESEGDVMAAERNLRRFLAQRQIALLRVAILVSRVGSGRLAAEQLHDRFAAGEPRVRRLDDAIQELVDDDALAGHIAEGLAMLVVEGVSPDTLLS